MITSVYPPDGEGVSAPLDVTLAVVDVTLLDVTLAMVDVIDGITTLLDVTLVVVDVTDGVTALLDVTLDVTNDVTVLLDGTLDVTDGVTTLLDVTLAMVDVTDGVTVLLDVTLDVTDDVTTPLDAILAMVDVTDCVTALLDPTMVMVWRGVTDDVGVINAPLVDATEFDMTLLDVKDGTNVNVVSDSTLVNIVIEACSLIEETNNEEVITLLNIALVDANDGPKVCSMLDAKMEGVTAKAVVG